MSARVMNALGASALERTICATAGHVGRGRRRTASRRRSIPRSGPTRATCSSGAGTRCPRRRTCGASCSRRARPGARSWWWTRSAAAPRGWPTSTCARSPAPTPRSRIGMMRAVVDAGLQDEDWCRAHADGYDDLLAALAEHPVERCAEICGVDAATHRAGRARVRHRPGRRCCGWAWAPSATSARPPPTRRSPRCRRSTGAWRDRGGGCSYIPTATAGAVSSRPARARGPAAGPGTRRSTCRSSATRSPTPRSSRRSRRSSCWNSNPAADRARPGAGARRACGARTCSRVVLEQFMTDTAADADVVLPATTQLEHLDVVFSWGHHYLTWNEPAIAPLGEAKPNTEIFRLLAARLGLDDPVLHRDRRGAARRSCSPAAPAGIERRAARARLAKIDLGQGPLRTPTAASAPRAGGSSSALPGSARLPATTRRPRWPTPALAERFPLALITPKTHLFLNSTFANQDAPARGPAEPERGVHPDDAGPRGHRGRRARAGVQRPRRLRLHRAGVRRRASRRAGGADGLVERATTPAGASAQATTSQVLTEAGRAPTFNDNRVELEPVR